jgi:hypothetical protein
LSAIPRTVTKEEHSHDVPTSTSTRRRRRSRRRSRARRRSRNSAGGFAFAVDDWTRLDRFLILGSEGGSYYATEREADAENAAAVLRCIAADGARVVARIVEISDEGRAPKNDPALFALALAAKLGDVDHAARGAPRAAAGRAHRNAPVPLRRVRQGARWLGPRHDAGVRALVQRHGRRAVSRSRP